MAGPGDLEREGQARRLETLGGIAAEVAHDFGNLLTLLLGQAELLRRELSANPAHEARLSAIVRAIEKGRSLVERLLGSARGVLPQRGARDLNSAVSEMIALLAPVLGDRFPIQTRLSPGAGTVRIGPGRVEQVILNLVLNARDAMPGGGTIHLETIPGRLRAALLVSDQGTGISAAIGERIFEPFFTTKVMGKGTGLGLSSVRRIAEEAGGSVSAESSAGGGTTFRVELPVGPPTPGDPPSAPTRPARETAAPSTILLVEDEESVRVLVKGFLEEEGHAVFEARSGDEAIEILGHAAPPVGLLVTDVNLPGVSGIDLARRLLARRPGLRVLFISGLGEQALSATDRLWAGVRVLAKPFTPGELALAVREVLAESRRG
ncbi:MAG: response regulator [Planctomycetes bacterium]|nr:response regulator [Planctomycetota bacterium]